MCIYIICTFLIELILNIFVCSYRCKLFFIKYFLLTSSSIEKFRGDSKQSFCERIQIFTAQLEVLDIDEEKPKQTLKTLIRA